MQKVYYLYYILLASFLTIPFSVQSQAQLPDNFFDQTILGGFERAVGFTFDENGRMYLWEKSGIVHLIENDELQPVPLLDISEEVGDYVDHGLLGFALHPNFLNNGYFYTLYVVDRHHLMYFGTSEYHPDSTTTHQATIGRITRFTADINTGFTTVVPESRHVILGQTKESGIPLMHLSHGVGSLIFGTDGSLLVSCGDGSTFQGNYIGTSGEGPHSFAHQGLEDGILRAKEDVGTYRAQLIDALNGKILRIDPETGDGIPSNPFYDETDPSAPRSKVYAMGFRNPYRITLLEGTGSHNLEDGNPGVIIAGDVGAAKWEEINIVKEPGKNHGWPLYEGMHSLWGFLIRPAGNQDAPNPLFGSAECDQEYFNFVDLLIQDTQNPESQFINPCSETAEVPEEIPTHIHKRPDIAFNNAVWNQPTRTEIPGYDAEGNAMVINIEDADSPIEGDIFEGIASIGGAFNSQDAFPEQYRNKYFNADYSGWIKYFELDDEYNITSVESFCDGCGDIVHIGFSPLDGSLYYVNFSNELKKITFGGNTPPVAVIDVDKSFGPGPLSVQFDASLSFDPQDDDLEYFWDFGDGNTTTAINPVFEFQGDNGNPRQYEVFLRVTDEEGAESTATKTISVDNTPPEAEIISFQDGDYYSVTGSTVLPLIANVSDAEHPLEELDFEWQIFFHHNTHFHVEPTIAERSPEVIISPTDCAETYYYRIQLRVSDPAGLTTITESSIYPNCFPDFFELEGIEATAKEDHILVEWSTVYEDNVSHFEIQRSPNTLNFETIGTTEAGGQTYNFPDFDPIWGTNNYRLKIFHEDGYFNYSAIASAKYPQRPQVLVFPNPSTGMINIEFQEITDIAEVSVFDAAGREIYSNSFSADEGLIFPLDFSYLANGVYLFRAFDGVNTIEDKFIIAK